MELPELQRMVPAGGRAGEFVWRLAQQEKAAAHAVQALAARGETLPAHK